MKQLFRHIHTQIAFEPDVVLFRNFHVPHGVLHIHLQSEICTIFINLSYCMLNYLYLLYCAPFRFITLFKTVFQLKRLCSLKLDEIMNDGEYAVLVESSWGPFEDSILVLTCIDGGKPLKQQ